MDKDHKLAGVLCEFASTMAWDVPVEDTLTRLVEQIVDLLPVSGAGITLISSGGAPRYTAASGPDARRFELLQTELREGPCVEAHASGRPVLCPDLRTDTRFPTFTRHALDESLAAVFAFPLRHGDTRLGALDLYRDTPGEIDPKTITAAAMLAAVAAAYLVYAQGHSDLVSALHDSRQNALHDPLTGLANRLLLFELLEQALQRNLREDKLVVILFCDLDAFKRINDAYGHQVGDELLISVAARLSRAVRPSDTLARIAGDEFVILCHGLESAVEAEKIAARALGSFIDPFLLSVGPVAMSASIGVAIADWNTHRPPDLMNDADAAMYRAKRSGGAAYQVIEMTGFRAPHLAVTLEGILRRSVQ
jgi:diguanylate cyclase (GGDEF)-like protein